MSSGRRLPFPASLDPARRLLGSARHAWPTLARRTGSRRSEQEIKAPFDQKALGKALCPLPFAAGEGELEVAN